MYEARQHKEKAIRTLFHIEKNDIRKSQTFHQSNNVYQFNLGEFGTKIINNFSEVDYFGGVISSIINALMIYTDKQYYTQNSYPKIFDLLIALKQGGYIKHDDYLKFWYLYSYIKNKRLSESEIEEYYSKIVSLLFQISEIIESIPIEKTNELKNNSTVKNVLKNIFDTGNCGTLANYLYEKTSGKNISEADRKHTKDDDLKLSAFLNEIQSPNEEEVKIIRVSSTIGHDFTLFVYESNVEIIQAWQGLYNVQTWLKKSQNVWDIEDFKNKIHILEDIDSENYNKVLFELFNVKEADIDKQPFGIVYFISTTKQKKEALKGVATTTN